MNDNPGPRFHAPIEFFWPARISRNRPDLNGLNCQRRADLSKPPSSPPSSDIDGVDEDQVRNTDAARASGEDAENLERARRESIAKPVPDKDEDRHRDDRSR